MVVGREIPMKIMSREPAKQTIRVELNEAEFEAMRDREHRLMALERALAAVYGDPLSGLQGVARVLPLAVGVEMVSIRLLARGTDALYLAACEGVPSREVRELALDPISVARLRSIFSLGGHHSHAHTLGVRYLSGEWLQHDSTVIGSITIGCRTDRRPSPDELDLVRTAAIELATKLAQVDRSEQKLRQLSHAIARVAILDPPAGPEDLLAGLRPREATVLELYADGRSVDEIADILVISPHTVRTHIKLAFRRLGIHSRDEAAELIRAKRLMAVL